MITDEPRRLQTPYLFDEFFDSGQTEENSPFLEPSSKRLGVNLPLKASLLAAAFLVGSFVLFLTGHRDLSHLLLVFVYFLAGIQSLIGAIEDLLEFEVNIDVLMVLAAFLSIIIGSGLEGGLLLVLFAFSGAMEESVTAKAKSALSGLRRLAPPKAYVVLADGSIIERSVKDIEVGEKILVKAGEVAPLDGEVTDGISSVNLVHLTGENLPVAKQVGDIVPAGARNLEGSLTIKVSHNSTESTLARLIKLITEAQEAKPRLQWWIDRLSRGYALSIIAVSFVFALLYPLISHDPYFGREGSVYRALAFLIAASPCALIIAIPIGYLSAISVCARNGVLLKGGIILDAFASCRAIAFDKTGTLTKAELKVINYRFLSENHPPLETFLQAGLSLEQNAVHPIALAICKMAAEKLLSPLPATSFRVLPGFGVEGFVDNQKAYVGRPEGLHIDVKEAWQEAKSRGQLLAIIALGEHVVLLSFEDQPRDNVKELIERLKTRFSLKTLILTGDHQESAHRIANMVGIDSVFAELRPEQKLAMVAELSSHEGLAMVGDGINDAPALTRATVGISMGKVGSSSAIDASDIVLLHDNIELLDWLYDKARKTRFVIAQNVTLALSAIVIASTLALFGIVPLWLAVVLHEGGTVIVGLNSLRLLRK